MVVNFKAREISRGARKLIRTSILIIKKKKQKLRRCNLNEICMFRKIDFSREIS
jgi:hypothetical protein